MNFSRFSNSASDPLPLIPRRLSKLSKINIHFDDFKTSRQYHTFPPTIILPPDDTHPEPTPPLQIPPAVEAMLVRKKSGQLVKSSLKSAKHHPRGALSVLTATRGLPSKSEPSTPTHSKAVHFDAHLEHVKLFLAEQKPLAVSRDGSPTDDTSGTDNDFPSFIYGTPDPPINHNVNSKKLAIDITNMPPSVDLRADVALEGLVVSQDARCVLGNMRVRNIAYHKSLAVRFTFDAWQTTSEVAGRYVASLGAEFDRFAFTIRLNDLLPRIDEKTLVLALRYTVGGREIWDNNAGRNYVVRFTRPRPKHKRVRAKSEGEPEPGAGAAAAAVDDHDLKSKLEDVLTCRRRNSANAEKPLDFKAGDSLATRYDFTTSSKSPWKPLPATSRNTIPWPAKTTSSPPLGRAAKPRLSPDLGGPETPGRHRTECLPQTPPPPPPPPPSDAVIDYGQFLTKYCFYTGSPDRFLETPVHRSHSASDVECFLSTSASTSTSLATPRVHSFESGLYRTGANTPTPAFVST